MDIADAKKYYGQMLHQLQLIEKVVPLDSEYETLYEVHNKLFHTSRHLGKYQEGCTCVRCKARDYIETLSLINGWSYAVVKQFVQQRLKK